MTLASRRVGRCLLVFSVIIALGSILSVDVKLREQQVNEFVPFETNSVDVLGAASRLRIAFITYSHLMTANMFDERIFPSLDTWLNEETYFVVLSNQWRNAYAELCANRTRYCEKIQTIWVDCPEGYKGESPCCKQQEGLIQMLDKYGHLHDYFAYFDDDNYFSLSYLEGFLQPLDKTKTFIVTSGPYRRKLALGQAGYASIRQYDCRTDAEFTYPWGQPVIYSRSALARVANGFRLGGLVKQCMEFNVTHDAGNGIFHWMYSLPEVRIRVTIFPEEHVRRYYAGMHHVANPDMKNYATMHQVHARFQNMTSPVFRYKWHNVTGFTETRTFCNHGDPSQWDEWHTLPVGECLEEQSQSQPAACKYRKKG